MQIRTLSLACAGLLLTLGIACGGGSSSPSSETAATPALGYAYTDPTGTGWRLVRDASSTSTRLVLNLVGPAGVKTRGVGFNLQAPTTVKFGTFSTGLPIQDTGVYQLRAAGSSDPDEPLALIGGVKKGNLLSVGIYQKDRAQGAQDSGAALCQVALLFDPAAQIPSGTTLTLSVPKAKVIPEDIGDPATDDLWNLDRKMRMAEISIAIGTLKAQ